MASGLPTKSTDSPTDRSDPVRRVVHRDRSWFVPTTTRRLPEGRTFRDRGSHPGTLVLVADVVRPCMPGYRLGVCLGVGNRLKRDRRHPKISLRCLLRRNDKDDCGATGSIAAGNVRGRAQGPPLRLAVVYHTALYGRTVIDRDPFLRERRVWSIMSSALAHATPKGRRQMNVVSAYGAQCASCAPCYTRIHRQTEYTMTR